MFVAGYGSEELKLRQLSAELNLKKVEFTGRVEPEKMPELYDKADIYLNSSIVDNMPLSIIEAFACGLPVATTDAGGIPYIVKNEETGLLAQVGNHRDLADKAMQLLENDGLAQKIIAKARAECVKYSWEQVRGRWLDIYQELAD